MCSQIRQLIFMTYQRDNPLWCREGGTCWRKELWYVCGLHLRVVREIRAFIVCIKYSSIIYNFPRVLHPGPYLSPWEPSGCTQQGHSRATPQLPQCCLSADPAVGLTSCPTPCKPCKYLAAASTQNWEIVL